MEDGSESDDDDFDMDEWWNKVKKGALAASARTGKDVLVEACETSESDEESEESDDGSDEESGEEGAREECGAGAAELTRGNLDKALWPAEKKERAEKKEERRSELKTGADAKATWDGDQRTSSKYPPSAETRFEERELLVSARVFKHCTAFDAFCFVELTWSLSAFSLIYF